MLRLLCASLLVFLSLAAQGDGIAAGPRRLRADIGTAGLDSVALQVSVGEMHVTASSDDKVHARITLDARARTA